MPSCEATPGFVASGASRLGRRCVPDAGTLGGIGPLGDRAFRAIKDDVVVSQRFLFIYCGPSCLTKHYRLRLFHDASLETFASDQYLCVITFRESRQGVRGSRGPRPRRQTANQTLSSTRSSGTLNRSTSDQASALRVSHHTLLLLLNF